MKMGPLLFIVYFSMVISSFLIFLFGDKGLTAQYKLIEHYNMLVSNIQDLEEKNRTLEARLDLLKSNPEQIRLLARELGLFRKGEAVVLFNKEPHISPSYDVGHLVLYRGLDGEKNNWLRIGGILGALVFMIGFMLLSPGGENDANPV